MPLSKLLLPPAQAGYSAQPGATVKRAKLGGGRSRFRLDLIGAPADVSVQWVCSSFEWQYLNAFVATAINTGALDFLMDLILEDAEPAEYQVHLIPGSFGLSGTRGLSFTATAALEVIPLPPNPTKDTAMIMLFEAYQEDAPNLLNALAILVNEKLTVLS